MLCGSPKRSRLRSKRIPTRSKSWVDFEFAVCVSAIRDRERKFAQDRCFPTEP